MKICQVTDHWYPDKTGGSCKYAYDLARLLEKEHDMHTFTLKGGRRIEESGLSLDKKLSKLNFIKNNKLFFNYAKNSSPDVVITHSALAYLHVKWACKFLGIPVVAVYHGPWGGEAYRKYRNLNNTKGAVLARLTYFLEQIDKVYLKGVNKVVFLSDYMSNVANKIYPIKAKSTRIPYWTSNEISDVGRNIRTPPYSCLVVRRLEYRMGIGDLFGILGRCPQGTRLKIIGTGTYENSLRQQVRNFGLEDKVEFLGYVSESEKEKEYRECDFMLLPSSDLEGFGIVILEALEQGAPVICKSGVGFLDYYSEDMSGAIIEYSDDDRLIEILTQPREVEVHSESFSRFHADSVRRRFSEFLKVDDNA